MQNEQITITLADGTESKYSMDLDLKRILDRVKINITKKDKDFVLIVDGHEGAGKSTLATQIGTYIDPSLTLDRICFSGKEFKEAIIKADQGQCVIFDEAFTGLASRSALSEINKMLVSLMMQMRQKNLFIIIVLPTFFLLDKYVALFRARALINVYELRGARGYFRMFNRKKKKYIYLSGLKFYNYGKVTTRIKGRFYGKFPLGEIAEELYRNKKLKALQDKEEVEKKDRFQVARDKLIVNLVRNEDLSERQAQARLMELGIKLDHAQIGNILRKASVDTE